MVKGPIRMGVEQPTTKQPILTKVVFGTIAGSLATIAVNPLDVVKVRMQVRRKTISTLETMRLIVQCEGYKSLYAGISAALVRQFTYTPARLLTYNMLIEHYKKRLPTEASISTKDKVGISVLAGLAGGLVATPSEVAQVRMSVDGPKLCSGMVRPRRYHGVFHTFYKIASEEGIRALWRGGTLTLWRSVAVTVSQIGTSSKINEYLKKKNLKRDYPVYILVAVTSAFVASCLSLPLDLIKTRIQNMSQDQKQRAVLKGVLREEGMRALWKGFMPYFVRLAPHTLFTFMFLEQMNYAYFNRRLRRRRDGA